MKKRLLMLNEACFEQFPVLFTERLELRAFEEQDIQSVFDLRTDKLAMKYMDTPLFENLSDAAAFVSKQEASYDYQQGLVWALCERKSRKWIGYCGFWRIVHEHGKAEVGYVLQNEYTGQGIMSEALRVILEYGFEQLGVHRIEANTNPHNIASVSLLKKFGFRQEAHLREDYFHGGQFLDSFVFGLLRSEWNSVKNVSV
jgi:[ribosomal protein S5]-alanine N-acetyltransferase